MLLNRTVIEKVAATPGWATVGHLFGAPFRSAGKVISRTAFGPVNRTTGKRLFDVGGWDFGKSLQQITKQEFDKLQGMPGISTYVGNVGNKTIYIKRVQSPGGAVGLAQRHPFGTAGVGLAAYMLTKPSGRATFKEMLPKKLQMTEAEAAQWAQPTYESPATQQVWG